MNEMQVRDAYARFLELGKASELAFADVRDLDLCSLAVATKTLSSAAEVNKWIEQLAPTQGWLRYQSELALIDHNEWRRDADKIGQLLYGELTNGEGQSLAIRPDGRGTYRIAKVSEADGKENYLAEKVEFLADWPGMKPRQDRVNRLAYRVYWQVHADGSRPALARFVGFR